MKLFDYLYYRIFYIYKNKWKDDTPGAYATSLVTLIQTLFLTLIPIFLYELLSNKNIGLNKLYLLGIFFIIFFLNFFRYRKFVDFDHLSQKWDKEETKKRKIKGILAILFIILTIGLALGLATVAGQISRERMTTTL